MLSVSRMKSLISPTFFSIISNPSKTGPFTLYFHPIRHVSSISKPRLNLHLLLVKPTMSNLDSDKLQTRTLSTEATPSSGEIHVIVGPMFAGKTTTLLRRIKAETSNGSFQVKDSNNLIHLNKTLRELCITGRVKEAIGIMRHEDSPLFAETYSILLQECIHRKRFRWGMIIHSHMIIVGFVINDYLMIKLLILYTKLGDLNTAHHLFDNLPNRTLVSWNAIIAGLVQKGDEKMGLRYYYAMRRTGLIPDQYTFASIFKACGSLAILEQGRIVHGIFLKCQPNGNIIVNSALMDMYFKSSSPYDGRMVFEKVLEKNVITWTALIFGLAQNGRVYEVLESYRSMLKEGCRPNYVTFLALLSACSYGGLVKEGWEYFLSMKNDYGIQPVGKHYAAMVDLLGRSGRLEEAFEFVKDVPCKEHAVIWGALLGASRIHGNADMLKASANKFFEMEPENAGKYVVLCNAYAAFGLWDCVQDVRLKMKNAGIKKEPGYSMIEIRHEVNFFFMDDNTDKKTEEIRELINSITCILKDAGFVLDWSSFS
ncbi:pentatricopeptide repeat-containing protein At4g16470-like isoform X1 [Impatiens glandulifera]|uniref:pentatricopeptide repeat-containing protein At4g16470-like isoform X1 n=1 Tax=Impatiens glandulifera TaxID=253017 RepID=UPI001FB0507F|nr:pentatricopeptide repeat-containing protein At4g16470-like isoform X1 [Impatiens glandulifera]